MRKIPKQERSRLLVESIIDATAIVIAKHGLAAATTARITDEVGISIGSLYQYFDNKEDFTIVNFLPAGPNVPYFIFLSSLDGKTFTQNAAFEEITTPEIDTKTQTIISNWRDGAATYGKSIYKLENNKPVMIEEQIATFDADGKCMASMKRLVDGTLKEVDKRPCPPEITE